MYREELTKIFMMISYSNKTLCFSWFIHKYFSVVHIGCCSYCLSAADDDTLVSEIKVEM